MPAVQIPVLMVANSASVDEYGNLTIQQGGWDRAAPVSLPCTFNAAVVGLAVFEDSEVSAQQVLRLTISDLAGTEPWFATSTLVHDRNEPAVPGVLRRAGFAVPFTFAAMKAAVARVSASHDGAELASCTFLIQNVVADAAPARRSRRKAPAEN